MLRWILLLLTLLPALPAGAVEAPLVTLRVFVDLECPYSRRAWPVYRKAAQEVPGTTLVVQHLPLASRHPLSVAAARAAVAARSQDKELAFVDALLAEPQPDESAIQRAAQAAGVDLTAFNARRQEGGLATAVEREQQAGLALGIQSTPSALVNGGGLGGVPAPSSLVRALKQATARAQADRQELGAAADLERLGVLRRGGEFTRQLDTVRQNRALTPSLSQPAGSLGGRWQVAVDSRDIAVGPPDATVTVVLFLQPDAPWQRDELKALLARRDADVRVVVKLLADPGKRGAKPGQLAFLFAGAALAQPQQTAPKLVEWATAGRELVWLDTDQKAAESPATTGWLHAGAALAQHTAAGPGAIFVNGRRWLGLAGDTGFAEAIAAARAEVKALGGKPQQAYAKLISHGKLLADVDLDLAAPVAADALPVWTPSGQSGPLVTLLVNFRSPHSRAAFYMLRRLVRSGDLPIRLAIAVVPRGPASAEQPDAAAILGAASLGKALELAELLFDAAKPDQWPTIVTLAKKCKLDVPTLQKAAGSAQTQDVLRELRRAQQVVDMQDEPVIFIGDRPYVGPLDEGHLERAVRHVRDTMPPPGAPVPNRMDPRQP